MKYSFMTFSTPTLNLADVDIHSGPPLQYGNGALTSLPNMRDVRLSLRRPETYGMLTRCINRNATVNV